ncbi:MAG: DNA helicase UvrD [Candidatus Magasanikbacteria bacterium CG10_big_fil_rev_8_21_14_0_10_36_32]|uniref:DNA helicase UvrD n=1 Tax=Candidatus Magasanikbacteria bacterium CG10_big_fil_rev_8_21_14_0_10_36_32 TaxID=1974646 RepID=A0A2M6W7E6_9BACT|nr:MAG: DNA helicase UvrD [Candidatus Magasanikbacteria bacterium CG10_big_fil_rev_8_21_14_0_10_36_32]
MIKKIIDLHIHSKYSRACSPELELPKIAASCLVKGINICATGDFTHPLWFNHIKDSLEEIGKSGLYQLKNGTENFKLKMVKFILSTEVACIYKHKDKCRRLHLVILAPNIAAVEKFNIELINRGVNLKSDGRPIMGLSAKEVLKIILAIDERFLMIPAHAWTPWFSVFGSKSGYDTLEDCFEELTPHIRAIETGLSSDPTMNHRLSKLDNIILVSNSDAHSLENLGREANILSFENEKDISFDEIKRIIISGDRKKFLSTIEFYPEEGKYHYDGHLVCEVCLSPKETKKQKYLCPKCKKKLTVGVLHRVDDLADREENKIQKNKFIPHRYIVPLREIIAKVFEVGVKSKKVNIEYQSLIKNLGSEFKILLESDIAEINKFSSDKNIVLAISNMRSGKVTARPGYDGKFGQIDVLAKVSHKIRQINLF